MLEHSQEERSSNMRRWGAGCLQTGKSGSERGCRMILTRDIRSPLYRFKGKDHFDSFCYPQSGFSLTQDNRVCLSKIGTIKVKMPKGKKARPLLGSQKTCRSKEKGSTGISSSSARRSKKWCITPRKRQSALTWACCTLQPF